MITKPVQAWLVFAFLLLPVLAGGQSPRDPRAPRPRRDADRAEAPAGAASEGPEQPSGARPDAQPRRTIHPLAMHPVMVALDENRDGVLSEEEIDMAVTSLRRLDRDNDGKITIAELLGAMQGAGREGEDRPKPIGARRAPVDREEEEELIDGDENPIVERYMRHDKDHDGRVNREELPRTMHRQLERWDANQDGALTREEIEQANERAPRSSRIRGRRADREGAPN